MIDESSDPRWQALMRVLPDAVMVFDAAGNYLDVWASDDSGLVAPTGDFAGRNVHDFFPEVMARGFVALLRSVVATGEVAVVRQVVEAEAGERLFEVRAAPLSGDRVLILSRNLTERRRLRREHRALTRAVSETLRREGLGLLAGGIAHDFNNLLTSILGNAGLLDQVLEAGSPGREYLADLRVAAEGARDLTAQLLAYAGKGEGERVVLDLPDLVATVRPLLSAAVGSSAELRVDTTLGLPATLADPAEIKQLLLNLVTNAFQALPDGLGRIRVTVSQLTLTAQEVASAVVGSDRPPGRYLTLEVADDGHGIGEATAAHVFEPFFTTRPDGRGLGLATVQGVVARHDGLIFLDSLPGGGTTMRILLPIAGASVAPNESRPTVRPEGVEAGPGAVLVADDEPMVRRVAERCLAAEGFRVLTAEDGAVALELLARRRDEIGLVLLDWKMPVMGGEEAFEQIRSRWPRLPVVFSTGFAGTDNLELLCRRGPTRLVRKPWDTSELVEAIRELISEAAYEA